MRLTLSQALIPWIQRQARLPHELGAMHWLQASLKSQGIVSPALDGFVAGYQWGTFQASPNLRRLMSSQVEDWIAAHPAEVEKALVHMPMGLLTSPRIEALDAEGFTLGFQVFCDVPSDKASFASVADSLGGSKVPASRLSKLECSSESGSAPFRSGPYTRQELGDLLKRIKQVGTLNEKINILYDFEKRGPKPSEDNLEELYLIQLARILRSPKEYFQNASDDEINPILLEILHFIIKKSSYQNCINEEVSSCVRSALKEMSSPLLGSPTMAPRPLKEPKDVRSDDERFFVSQDGVAFYDLNRPLRQSAIHLIEEGLNLGYFVRSDLPQAKKTLDQLKRWETAIGTKKFLMNHYYIDRIRRISAQSALMSVAVPGIVIAMFLGITTLFAASCFVLLVATIYSILSKIIGKETVNGILGFIGAVLLMGTLFVLGIVLVLPICLVTAAKEYLKNRNKLKKIQMGTHVRVVTEEDKKAVIDGDVSETVMGEEAHKYGKGKK